MIKQNSILDYVHSGLSPEIWGTDTNLLPQHELQILEHFNSCMEELGYNDYKNWVGDIKIVGSICTYQWTSFSDVDVHVEIDFNKFKESHFKSFSDDDVMDNVWMALNYLNKVQPIVLSGTYNPVEYFWETGKTKPVIQSGVYNMTTKEWERKPKEISEDFDVKEIYSEIFNNAKSIMVDMDINIGEIKRDIKDIKLLEDVINSWEEDKQKAFKDKLQKKFNELESEIKDLIGKAEDVIEEKEKSYNPSGESVIKFKFLQKYGYLSLIKYLEKILQKSPEDVITKKKVKEVEDVLIASTNPINKTSNFDLESKKITVDKVLDDSYGDISDIVSKYYPSNKRNDGQCTLINNSIGTALGLYFERFKDFNVINDVVILGEEIYDKETGEVRNDFWHTWINVNGEVYDFAYDTFGKDVEIADYQGSETLGAYTETNSKLIKEISDYIGNKYNLPKKELDEKTAKVYTSVNCGNSMWITSSGNVIKGLCTHGDIYWKYKEIMPQELVQKITKETIKMVDDDGFNQVDADTEVDEMSYDLIDYGWIRVNKSSNNAIMFSAKNEYELFKHEEVILKESTGNEKVLIDFVDTNKFYTLTLKQIDVMGLRDTLESVRGIKSKCNIKTATKQSNWMYKEVKKEPIGRTLPRLRDTLSTLMDLVFNHTKSDSDNPDKAMFNIGNNQKGTVKDINNPFQLLKLIESYENKFDKYKDIPFDVDTNISKEAQQKELDVDIFKNDKWNRFVEDIIPLIITNIEEYLGPFTEDILYVKKLSHEDRIKGIRAMYSPGEQSIYLADDMDGDVTWTICDLLHEFLHANLGMLRTGNDKEDEGGIDLLGEALLCIPNIWGEFNGEKLCSWQKGSNQWRHQRAEESKVRSDGQKQFREKYPQDKIIEYFKSKKDKLNGGGNEKEN